MPDALPFPVTGTLGVNGWGYVVATFEGSTRRYAGHIMTSAIDDQTMICVTLYDGDTSTGARIIPVRNIEAIEMAEEEVVRGYYQRVRESEESWDRYAHAEIERLSEELKRDATMKSRQSRLRRRGLWR